MLFRNFSSPMTLVLMLAALGCNRDKGTDDTGSVGVDAEGDRYVAGEDLGGK